MNEKVYHKKKKGTHRKRKETFLSHNPYPHTRLDDESGSGCGK